MGDASGPNQTATNPSGLGDKITDYVDYSPWLGDSFEVTPRTYHVNPTGTIQEAIDEARLGDTIIVHPGVYNENLVVPKSLIIQGMDKETTIIQAQPVSPYGGDKAVEIQASDVIISGFTISGYAGTDDKPGKTYWGVYAYGSSSTHYGNIVVTDSIFTFLCQGGIRLGYIDGSLIANNIFRRETRLVWYDPPGATPGSYINVTRGGAGPELWHCTDVTIDPNVIETYGVGIFLYGSNNIRIEANLISAPDTTNPSDEGIHVEACNAIHIIGNTIENFTAGLKEYYNHGTKGAAIYLTGSSDCTLERNLLANNTIAIFVDMAPASPINKANYNNIEENKDFGIFNAKHPTSGTWYYWEYEKYSPPDNIVDGTFNWCGHETGPYHPTSWMYKGSQYGPHYGLGDNVSDYVLYYPWLSEPSGLPVEPPTANFTYSSFMPRAGETVTFDASSSTPNGGAIVLYVWDFGDGNTTITSDPIVTHVYDSLGKYNVTLTAIDSEGLTNSTRRKITVTHLCDVTYDGNVDMKDLYIIAINYGWMQDPDP